MKAQQIIVPKDYISLDIEGNGYWGDQEDIVEIAFVHVRDGVPFVLKNYQLKPHFKINSVATKIHGLSNADVAQYPKFKDVESDILGEISGQQLLLHNAKGDLSLLSRKMRAWIPDAHLDTLKIAKEVLPTLKSHKLISLVEHFQLAAEIKEALLGFGEEKRNRPHTAPYDAMANIFVLNKLLAIQPPTEKQFILF
jgi:exodeoxyribonuclease X